MIEARQGENHSYRLLYVTAAFPWPESEAFLIPEIQALTELGCAITIVPTRIIEPPLILPDEIGKGVHLHVVPLSNVRLLATFLFSLVAMPLRILSLSYLVFGSGFRKGLKNIAVLPKAVYLAKLYQNDKPAHIHAHWAGVSSTLGMLMAKLLNTPFSITAHSWDVSEDNLLALKSEAARFIRFISERERKRGLRLGARSDKSPVLHIGVANTKNVLKPFWPNKGKIKLICVASLLEVKGHVYLIDALKLLRRRGLDVHLTLIGDGPLRESLETRSKDIENAIEFRGSLPHAILQKTLSRRSFHIGVLASIVDSTGEDEGIPISLVEMMGFGIPVIATATGSIPELLPAELKLTVPEKQPVALADAIELLINNQHHYESIAERMIDIVRTEYSIDAIAPRLLRLMAQR